jgi:hypothetical protein
MLLLLDSHRHRYFISGISTVYKFNTKFNFQLLTQIYRSACNTDTLVDGGQSTGEKRTLGISNGNTIKRNRTKKRTYISKQKQVYL